MNKTLCINMCKTKKISSKEPAIRLLLTVIQKETGVKIRKCEEFCQVYPIFLEVAEYMFGYQLKVEWRKQLNANKIKLYKCFHCGELFELRTATEHIVKYMKERGLLWTPSTSNK